MSKKTKAATGLGLAALTMKKADTLAAVEIGTLAMGTSMIAFPRLQAHLDGVDPNAGATTDLIRGLGFWLTTYGVLLQHVDDEDERERLLMAGAAVGSAFCLNSLVAAGRKKMTWRGALTNLAMVGTMVGFACAYLSN
ncbi:MAG TPA: hypothetical protein VFJ21_06205 [Mycobacteriales bacterium]|jgi:hypothetical protein|nr:hypothetical protein [Mycobacteriales bacterium]